MAANWEVNTASLTTQNGAATGTPTVNLTITNVINGVHTGYLIEAKNFKVGGGNNSTGNTWVDTSPSGWNVDSGITSVTFSDNGIPGDPSNTVNVAVVIANTTINDSGASTVHRNRNVYIDIDENTTPPEGDPPRDVCIETHYDYYANHTVSVTNISDITETTIITGSGKPNNININKHEGTVSENQSTKVAQVSFTRNSGYYYHGDPNVSFNNLGDYNRAYNAVVVEKSYSGNLLISFKVDIFYTPPTEGNIATDPEDFCSMGHQALIDVDLRQITTAETNNIYNVSHESYVLAKGGETIITVTGTPNTSYTIQVNKTTALDSNSIPGSNGYYNWDTAAFQTGSATQTGTTDDKGINYHFFSVPQVTSDQRYDIVLAGAGSPTSTLHSRVPNAAGEAKIIQYGVNVLTVGVVSSASPSGFGTLPSAITITKPNYNSAISGLDNPKTSEKYCIARASTEVRGSSKGTSSTRLVLNDNKKVNQIHNGYLVFGTGVPHNTTVVKVDNRSKTVTLSQAAEVNNAYLTFRKNLPIYKTFQFTIPPDSTEEGGADLSVNTSNPVSENFTKIFNVPQSVTGTVNGAVSPASATITLDSTNGLVPGLTVAGTGITGTPTISSITNSTVIVLSETETLSDDTVLTFTGGVGSGVTLLHSNIAKVGHNIVIDGLLRVTDIEASITTQIQLDNVITVA